MVRSETPGGGEEEAEVEEEGEGEGREERERAIERARCVFPVPGGPCKSIPRGGFRPATNVSEYHEHEWSKKGFDFDFGGRRAYRSEERDQDE